MAWRSSGSSNTELIENLYRHRLITDSRVKEAFLKVPPLLQTPLKTPSLTCV